MEFNAEVLACAVQHPNALGNHFLADPVAGDRSNLERFRGAIPERGREN